MKTNFFAQVLGLALDLVKADRGALVEVNADGWQYAAFRGIRPEAFTGALSYVDTLIGEVLRHRKLIATSGKDEEEKYGSRANLAGMRDRMAILVPIATDEEILGILYLDRADDTEKGFLSRSESLLEQFAPHVAVAWRNRKTFLTATTWPDTTFLVEPYFCQVVKQAVEQQERGGSSFALLGVRLSFPLRELAGPVAKDIQYVIGRERRVGVLNGTILVTLLTGESSPQELTGTARDIVARLKRLVPIKGFRLLTPESSVGGPNEWLRILKDELNPSAGLVEEIESLAGSELSLKDAKQLLEKHVIMKALRQAHGNITRAAQVLGVHRPQLSQLVRKHELKRESFSGSQASARAAKVQNL